MFEEMVRMLGHYAQDRVTGQEGVVTSVCIDLYGCKQVILTPRVDKDGKRGDAGWFDLNRLRFTSSEPVMVCPLLKEPAREAGGAEKPLTAG